MKRCPRCGYYEGDPLLESKNWSASFSPRDCKKKEIEHPDNNPIKLTINPPYADEEELDDAIEALEAWREQGDKPAKKWKDLKNKNRGG